LDRDGRAPLFQAVISDDIATANELLRHGADVNAQDRNAETPLHFAARDYKLELAGILLGHGAYVDAQDTHGNTPLSRAVFASQGRGGMIALLLKHSANKALKNKHGVSPADLANSIGNIDVRGFLE
jgi:ankyrin repeat protein